MNNFYECLDMDSKGLIFYIILYIALVQTVYPYKHINWNLLLFHYFKPLKPPNCTMFRLSYNYIIIFINYTYANLQTLYFSMFLYYRYYEIALCACVCMTRNNKRHGFVGGFALQNVLKSNVLLLMFCHHTKLLRQPTHLLKAPRSVSKALCSTISLWKQLW